MFPIIISLSNEKKTDFSVWFYHNFQVDMWLEDKAIKDTTVRGSHRVRKTNQQRKAEFKLNVRSHRRFILVLKCEQIQKQINTKRVSEFMDALRCKYNLIIMRNYILFVRIEYTSFQPLIVKYFSL